jgi:hypothetical protein
MVGTASRMRDVAPVERVQSRMRDGKIRVLCIRSGGFTAGDSAARCPYQSN